MINFSFSIADPSEVEKYLRAKIPISSKEYYRLLEKYQAAAFTAANYNNVKILEKFQEELARALEEGTTMEEFQKRMDHFLKDHGYKGLTNFRADNIFRTNMQTAYQIGHYESMTDPDVKKLRPYWQYVAVDDNHTRNSHRELNGKVYHCDSPVWDTIYPPNGYRCRCTVKTLSKRQVEQRGLTVEEELPKTAKVWDRKRGKLTGNREPFGIDPKFRRNAAKDFFEMDLSDLPPILKEALRRKNKQGENRRL